MKTTIGDALAEQRAYVQERRAHAAEHGKIKANTADGECEEEDDTATWWRWSCRASRSTSHSRPPIDIARPSSADDHWTSAFVVDTSDKGRHRLQACFDSDGSDAHVSGGHDAVLVGALHDQEPAHQEFTHDTHKTSS